MSLIKHRILSVLGNENDNSNADSNYTTFTIKAIKLYGLVVTLSAKDNQNAIKKDLQDQCFGMNLKRKVRIRIRQTSIYIFLKEISQELTDCLF